jgi:hypothetical protein
MDKAMEKYSEIQPYATKKSLKECFTEEAGRIFFWFNVQGGNTKVLIEGRVI